VDRDGQRVARRLAASALEMTSAEAVRQAAAAFLGT
jgi:hypothetical protein